MRARPCSAPPVETGQRALCGSNSPECVDPSVLREYSKVYSSSIRPSFARGAGIPCRGEIACAGGSFEIVRARRPSDVLNNLLSWFLRCSGLLSHLRSCERYDEPETLPYSIHPVCPMTADGGQCTSSWLRPVEHAPAASAIRTRATFEPLRVRDRSAPGGHRLAPTARILPAVRTRRARTEGYQSTVGNSSR